MPVTRNRIIPVETIKRTTTTTKLVNNKTMTVSGLFCLGLDKKVQGGLTLEDYRTPGKPR